MRRRIIIYAIVVGVIFFIYYKKHKCSKSKEVPSTSVLHNVSRRAVRGTDPVRLTDSDSIQVVCKIYEGLYEYHYLKKSLELVPNLAEGMPSISPDGLIYIFKIKQGVLFQDDACFPGGKGRELKAADFVFTLKRIVDPKNSVHYVDLINGKIKGLDSWKQLCDYTQEVEGLRALDDYTLQVTLTKPWPCFLNFLAMWLSFVVAQEAVMHYGLEFLNHPVGTGPFTLPGGFDPQSPRLEFVKNPTFREKLFPSEADPQYQHMLAYAGKKLPLVDKVVTHVITEEHPRWLEFQNAAIDIDRIDGTAFSLGVIRDGVLSPELVQKGLVFNHSPGAMTEFFVFNHKHPLFNKNHYLRQAMAMAFDRDTYNQMFYNHGAEVAQSLVPPALMDGVKALTNPYPYDLERAKECLVAAGYPGGKGLPVIILDVRSETAYKNKADFFAKCMAKIGIEVQVVNSIWPDFSNKVRRQATMMHLYTWYADYPDPSCFLQLITSKHFCGLEYANVEFNELFDKAVATTNRQERYSLYAKLNKLAVEQVPMIYAVHGPTQFLYYKWVKNVVVNEFNYALDQYITVDMEEKAKLTAK